MNKEDFSAWRSHPITGEVFRYFQDYANELARLQATTDYQAQPSDVVARVQAQTYGMCSVLEDIVDPDFCDDITNFYKIEAENEEVQQAGNTPD